MKKISNINIKNISLWFVIISVLFVVNYMFKFSLHTNIRTLYLDDLATYSLLIKGNLFDAFFLSMANKLRPVAHMIIYIAFKITGTDFQRLDILILVWNLLIAVGVTVVTYQLIGDKASIWVKGGITLVVGMLYSISRFSYYVWTEVLGLMESTALLLALGVLLLLIQYVFDSRERNLYIADLLYLIVIYTHERYIFLGGVIFISIFLKHGIKKPLKYVAPVMVLIVFMLQRFLMFGNRFLDGTGGTSVIDTFNLKDVWNHIICQSLYLLGINAGPAYLNGIGFESVSRHIGILIVIQIIFVSVCFFSYLLRIIKGCDIEEQKKSVLYISFIICCIVSSSITIRVEMRWIYVSYAAFLIYMAQILAYLIRYFDIKKFIIPVTVYMVFGMICEEYYQSYYKNIYYWGTRLLTSSLYEQTLIKYGEDFFNKNVYIIGNSMMWTTTEWSSFYSQFFNEDLILSNVIYVEYIEELYEKLSAEEQSIILLEDLSDYKYVDLTEKVYGIH